MFVNKFNDQKKVSNGVQYYSSVLSFDFEPHFKQLIIKLIDLTSIDRNFF
jgi:hypothetical protein